MPTQILAANNTAADSSDIVITGNTTVCLKDGDNGNIIAGNVVIISLKDDSGSYVRVGELSSTKPALVISGPGTYRFSRLAGGIGNVGVFSG